MSFKPCILTRSRLLLSYLLPPLCVICGLATHSDKTICQGCQQALPSLSHSCQRCAQFLPASDVSICGTCLLQPPPFDITHALGPYEPPLSSLIIRLKFQHQLNMAQALGELMANKIQTQWYTHQPLPDLILPLPLHIKRLRQRGFNQAIEIARPLARALSLPLDIIGISRIKPTAPQSALPAAQRKNNVANAFKAHRDYSGLSLAVIDDVMTTGHTLAACCRLLKEQGAKRIDVWCCARREVALKAKTS